MALCLFDNGIDGIAQEVHDGLAEHVGIAVEHHCFCGQGEYHLDMILLYLLGELLSKHLLTLLEHGPQVHVHVAACAVFQHLQNLYQYMRHHSSK